MNDQATPTPDPIVATLREREAELLTELADAHRALAVVTARLDEVRDLISKMTDGRRRPRKKAAAAESPSITEPVGETAELAI